MSKTFHEAARGWLDGTTQSLAAQTFRLAASFVATPYSGVVRLRNRLYDLGLLRSSKAPRPTISVGNLTLGGVGKTPFVGWLADFFTQTAQTPAFISRGYQAERQRELFARVDAAQTTFSPQTAKTLKPLQASEDAQTVPISRLDLGRFAQFQHFNDEARELALLFPETPHFLGSNRVEVAAALVEARPDVDVLLLDDAFQHRRIKRDLDVVLLDALNPFGGGRVFPAGFLREPIAGLARADVVLLNRADLVSVERRRAIRSEVERRNPAALFAEIAQIPRFIFSRRDAINAPFPCAADPPQVDGASATFAPPCPSSLVREDFATWRATRRGSRFLAFCGLGAPSGFRKTLETNELTPTSFVAFPDHCAYSANDFASLAAEAERIGADAILTTAKDFVKLPEATLAGRPLFALGIGVEFLSGEGALRALLNERFPSRP
ncbi:MAG: tetraacyldisaccharide 4'-kinase [Thermoguttaceae bacterium]|nr:tetraacyldisaccharide 4'-kinase [Thermoguttaceae bacterium]